MKSRGLVGKALSVYHLLHPVAPAFLSVTRVAALFEIEVATPGNGIRVGRFDHGQTAAFARSCELLHVLFDFFLHLFFRDFLFRQFFLFLEIANVELTGAFFSQQKYLVDKRVTLRLPEVPPRRHRGAGHAAKQHGVQVLASRDIVRCADQPKPSSPEIPRFWEQVGCRNSLAVTILAMACGTMERIKFFPGEWRCRESTWNRRLLLTHGLYRRFILFGSRPVGSRPVSGNAFSAQKNRYSIPTSSPKKMDADNPNGKGRGTR